MINRKTFFDGYRHTFGKMSQDDVDNLNRILDESENIKTNKMKTNQEGIDLIKSFEGLRLKAYRDAVGVVTIGYGTTRIDGKPVQMGTSITNEQAEDYLKNDLEKFENAVNSLITVPLNENQFAAIVSLTYNVGEGNLGKSTLRRRLNAGDYNVGNEFGKWNKAGGKVLAGLTRRRAEERNLFEKPIS